MNKGQNKAADFRAQSAASFLTVIVDEFFDEVAQLGDPVVLVVAADAYLSMGAEVQGCGVTAPPLPGSSAPLLLLRA